MLNTLGSKTEVFEAIARERHSCRAFLNKTLPDETIRQLLELAQRAPSDCNTQAWTTYVIGGAKLEQIRQKLYERASNGVVGGHDVTPIDKYEGDHLARRRECGWSLYEAVGITKGDREGSRIQALKNFEFFGAPHVALITAHSPLGERGVFDAGIYAGYFLLAAEALGVGAVAQGAVARHASFLREELGIPEEHRIICAISFGPKDEEHPANSFRTTRVGLEEAVVFAND